MADNSSEQEPSIEEILASIRQIISDDDEDSNEENEVVEDPVRHKTDDVLELTEEDLAEQEPEPEEEEEPESEEEIPESPPIEIHSKNMIQDAVKDIVECLETGKEPNCIGMDGLKSLEIICAFLESAANNNILVSLPINNNITINSK